MQDGRKVELGGVGKEWLDVDCSLREECVRKGCEELFSTGVAGAGWWEKGGFNREMGRWEGGVRLWRVLEAELKF